MNTRNEILELFERDRQAWSSYHDAAVTANRKAIEDSYGAASDNEIVRVAMGGDFQIQALGIHPEVYDDIDEDELSESIVSAYNKARVSVQFGLLQAAIDPHGDARQEPAK